MSEEIHLKSIAAMQYDEKRFSKLKLFLRTIPGRFQLLWVKAITGKASPRAAIKAKCYECCGHEDTVTRIEKCGAVTCPLWAYRPYGVEKKKRVRKAKTDIGREPFITE